jgi:alcohol dehydrogenase
MRAAIFETYRQPLEIRNVPDPACPADGAIIDVKACGVCRSDHHSWSGADPIALPHVPGHEFSGIVAEVGPFCRRFKKGDRVTAPFILGCGICPDCQGGHATICNNQITVGFAVWGAFAERIAIPRADFNLVPLPESLSFELAAAMGCRVTTAFQALVERGQVRPGEWVAVHGSGGVGLSAIMIARAIGARVIATDIRDESLALAKAAGAEITVNASTPDLGTAIRDLTGGGVHVSLDALGILATFDNSIRSLRKFGRHVQIGMPVGNHVTVPLPLLDILYARQVSLLGSRGMPAIGFRPLLAMVESGALDLGPLIKRRIALEEAGAALAALDSFTSAGITVIDRFAAQPA